jgi:DNA-binding transcriptional LysR family regulator
LSASVKQLENVLQASLVDRTKRRVPTVVKVRRLA